MPDKQLFTGIILAGGQSSRLGMDKGLIEWRGRRIIEYAADTLSPFCSELIVSSNNQEYTQYINHVVPDIRQGYGPMMGLYSALKASSTELNLVLAVDNILVTRPFYRYLLSVELSELQVALPYIQNKFYEPLVGYYHKDCEKIMERMMNDGNYKLPDLISQVLVKKLLVESDFPDFHPNYFRSLNSSDDLILLNDIIPGGSVVNTTKGH
jgi:molybdopterin-guanine dinucleotide biosynthesis protein A